METAAAVELRPARFSDRFVAYLIDTVPFMVGAVLSVWLWGGPLARPVTGAALSGLGAVWMGLAAVWQWAGNMAGGTVGKKLLGLRVVTADGSPPGAARAALRAGAWLLSTPLANFGFWLALFHPRTRTLHDLIAGTYVVEEGPRRSDGALLFAVAAAAAIGLFILQYAANVMRPTPADMGAIAKAEEGLDVVGRMQEAYKAKNGVYAGTVEELASVSGDPEVFRSAMLDVFAPAPFRVVGGMRKWHVTAAAKDRRHTLVSRDGP